jgi:hypothetical protein
MQVSYEYESSEHYQSDAFSVNALSVNQRKSAR